jgi:hypothetical protein
LATEHARVPFAARVFALLLCACAPAMLDAASAAIAPARTRAPGEVEIEAAYQVNFLRYTQWPSTQAPAVGGNYIVTVVGSQSAADSVRAVCSAANGIEGRGIEVHWLPQARGSREAPFDSAQDAEARAQLRGSHLVFFHRSSGKVHPQVLDDLAGTPVLTVSDNDDFTRQGGMLGLVRSNGRIVFQANNGAIRTAGLLVSAKVLKLARADTRALP